MSDNEEVAVMLLRNGYRAFGELSDEGIDDAVLDANFFTILYRKISLLRLNHL